jgi:hypothetical protein
VISRKAPLITAVTRRTSLLLFFRGTITVPITLATALSTSTAPAAAATSRIASGTIIGCTCLSARWL